MNSTKYQQAGSALFYILIGCALFAALSFVVGGMLRGGNTGMISEEKAGIAATEILDYAASVKRAIQEMQIENGCSETDISFDNDVVGGYTNGANTACQVFDSAGGGLNWRNPESEWLDTTNAAKSLYGQTYYPEGSCVVNVGTNSGSGLCDSDGDEEVMLIIPWIKEEICLQINQKVGVTNTNNTPPQDNNLAWSPSNPKFTGDFSGSTEIGESGGTAVYLRGKSAACFKGSSTQAGGYHFYQVLIPR